MKYTISCCYFFPDGSVWYMDNLLCLIYKRGSILNFHSPEYPRRLSYKKSFCICIKVDERRRKDMWKMSLVYVRIAVIYGRPNNVNLTHSIKFITRTFLKYSFIVPSESKNSWVYPISSNFEEKFYGHPKCVLKWRFHIDILGTSSGRQF